MVDVIRIHWDGFETWLLVMEDAEMLVLSRKAGEDILIGDNIRLVVNRISGNRVTVGIEAPDDVHVIRGELKTQDPQPSREPVEAK